MSEEKKRSTVASLTASFQRVKAQADKYKETGTVVMRDLVSSGEGVAAGGAAGFGNEYFGEVDVSTGARMHKISGVPTSLIATAGLKLFGALGTFGEMQRDAFAIGTGVLSAYGSDQGRGIARRLLASKNRTEAAKAAELPAKPIEVTAPAQQTQTAAVATG